MESSPRGKGEPSAPGVSTGAEFRDTLADEEGGIREEAAAGKARTDGDEGLSAGAGEEKKGGRQRRPAWRRVLKALEWAVALIVSALVLLAAFLMVAPRFGLSAHPVLSGSMEPALKVGGMIICRDIPVGEVKVGDIIGFNTPNGQKITHRVIDIVEEEGGKRWFRTKGDANEDPDPDLVSISTERVDKVVYHLPYLGFFSSFMQKKLAFLVFICAPALILLVLFSRDLVKAVEELKREGAGRGG